ncbi:glycosyltransferase [Actinocrinis puniceicyclus]|uniref:Glycosyltransferase n=1 Tax=Actinocrinis puniceicyclus TaxID=977794 RepID=A0A8J7WRG1_9ACTN|nr:glycosyltransferase family 2 protein [Actinocrinis puniceicyclus]MBS2966138.1 glycosyltransferase [Actinocrinis puniceicyclus]
MSTPTLSVIIPCRLGGGLGAQMRGALLRLTLVALDCQTTPRDDFEVVLVDDASSIDLDSFVGSFGHEYPSLPLRVLRNAGPVYGQSHAYNLGLDAARGRIVLLCTDDSLLAPDTVGSHIAAHEGRLEPAYVCGIERQYMFSVLFRDVIAGTLQPPGDLAIRVFGALLGFTDLRRTAEQLGFTDWAVTPNLVRHHYDELQRRSALTPGFEDMYRELESDRTDMDWLAVRMGNHSIRRQALKEIGDLDEGIGGSNSDQALGLRLQDAAIPVVLDRGAHSVLLEHRRDLRSFTGESGLAALAARWPRPDVLRLREYFALGYERSISAYRNLLS